MIYTLTNARQYQSYHILRSTDIAFIVVGSIVVLCVRYSLTINKSPPILDVFYLWSASSIESDVRANALWPTARLKESQREPFALQHEAIHLVFLTLLLHVPLPGF